MWLHQFLGSFGSNIQCGGLTPAANFRSCSSLSYLKIGLAFAFHLVFVFAFTLDCNNQVYSCCTDDMNTLLAVLPLFWIMRCVAEFNCSSWAKVYIVWVFGHLMFVCRSLSFLDFHHDPWNSRFWMSTVLTQDHFYSDRYIYKLQHSSSLWLWWCLSAREAIEHAGQPQLDEQTLANVTEQSYFLNCRSLSN